MTFSCLAIAALTSGVGERGDDGVVEALDLRRRKLGGRDHGEPAGDVDVRKALLGNRRQVGQRRHALLAHHADGAQRAALDVRLHRGHGDDAHLDLPADQVGDFGPTPLYGMCLTSTPAASTNISSARWMIVPLPDDA